MNSELLHHLALTTAPEPPKPLDYLTASTARRKAHAALAYGWLANSYFRSDRDHNVTQLLDDIVAKNSAGLPGTGTVALLTGPNCVGKSTLIDQWAFRRYREAIAPWSDPDEQPRHQPPRSHVMTVPRVPVLTVSIDSETTKQVLDQEIFEALGYLRSAAKKEGSCEVLVRHGVQILIIDDLHLLADTPSRGRSALNHIKAMLTKLGHYGITVVLVGANLHEQPILSDPQATRRMHLIDITGYNCSTTPQARDWQWFLTDAEDTIRTVMPTLPAGALAKQLPQLILERSDGLMSDACTIFCEAPALAIQAASPTITAEHINAIKLSAAAEDRETAKTGPGSANTKSTTKRKAAS